MTDITIREIQGDEILEIMYLLTAYAFHPSPPLPDKEERQEVLKGREGVTYFALFEDDKAVASVASSSMTQHVRGKMYSMAGIWGVATFPEARRKGYSRRLLKRLLDAERQNGKTFSCLYPFRESFYERLGYLAFPIPRKAIFSPSKLSSLLDVKIKGNVERILIGEGYDQYQDYLHQMQNKVHGWTLFDKPDISGAQRNRHWLLLAKVDGELVGLMLYDLKGDMVTEFNMRALRFYYTSSEGKYLLLTWIARHIDQAAQVEIWLPPYEYPETWWHDLQIKMEPIFLAPMGRVLDVAKLNGMVCGDGQFSARIYDPQCPWNEGSWHFESDVGALVVSPADDATCSLSIHALSALVYGTHDPQDFYIRNWGAPPPDLQRAMRNMVPSVVPYLHEMF